ncbi:hypothetical protein Tco_1134856 [Tanacetum coccineum]
MWLTPIWRRIQRRTRLTMLPMLMTLRRRRSPPEDDDDEEEEHLAPADSTAIASLAVDPVPSTKETKPFKTDESTATPPPPPAYRTTSRMFIRSQTPIPFPSEVEVARFLALPTPPPSPLTPLSSLLPQIPPPPTSPTYA